MHFSSWKENNRFVEFVSINFQQPIFLELFFLAKDCKRVWSLLAILGIDCCSAFHLHRFHKRMHQQTDTKEQEESLFGAFSKQHHLLCLFCKLSFVKAGNMRKSWSEQSVPYLRIFFIGPACKTHLPLSFNIKTRLHLQEARIATLVSES